MNRDIKRLKMVLPEREFERIEESEDGFIVDVHEFHRAETKRMINNMINIIKTPCVITVIHGYNRGTVLLQMIRTDMVNPKIKKISTVEYNHGVTFLEVA